MSIPEAAVVTVWPVPSDGAQQLAGFDGPDAGGRVGYGNRNHFMAVGVEDNFVHI